LGHNGAAETVNVKTSKQEARALEKRGDTAKALAVYREILDHLEGSKAILRELPLYVRVGDLYLKEDDTKTALAMYDKAGRLYAEHGSGKSVIAVCGKILKVLPEGTHTHIHYARLLIDGGHVGEARKVLVNYAEVFELPKVQQALEVMEGKSDEEMGPMLEMVLEMAEWGEEEGATEPEATARASEIAELDEEPEQAEPEPESAPTPFDSLEPVDMRAEVVQPDIAQPDILGDQGAKESDEFEIAQGMTDMLEERPVQRTSKITGDIASEVEAADREAQEQKAESDGDSLIMKSGEGYDIQEAAVAESAPGPEENAPEIARPEIPVADAPPPTAAEDLGDVPAIDLRRPDRPHHVADGLRLVDDGVSPSDPGPEDLEVDRFSEGPPKKNIFSSDQGTPTTPTTPRTPTIPTPRPPPARPLGTARASASQPRPSAGHRRVSASHRGQGGRASEKPQSQKSHRVRNVVLGIVAIGIGVALTRLVPYGGGSRDEAAPAADSSVDTSAAATQVFRPPPAPAQPTDSVALLQLPPFDSILDSVEIDVVSRNAADATQAAATGDSAGVSSPQPEVPVVGVGGLPIESVRALITPSRTGSRVVQILESGERLTLTIFPIPRELRSRIPMGRISMSTTADGITEGTTRVGNYQVRARAPINAELLEVLLQQLVEVTSN
jgi:hypothetical protein